MIPKGRYGLFLIQFSILGALQWWALVVLKYVDIHQRVKN